MKNRIIALSRVDGDVGVFDSPTDAQSYLELIDIQSDEFEFFDESGRVWRIRIDDNDWELVSTQLDDSGRLKVGLRDYLLQQGGDGAINQLDLTQLVDTAHYVDLLNRSGRWWKVRAPRWDGRLPHLRT